MSQQVMIEIFHLPQFQHGLHLTCCCHELKTTNMQTIKQKQADL